MRRAVAVRGAQLGATVGLGGLAAGLVLADSTMWVGLLFGVAGVAAAGLAGAFAFRHTGATIAAVSETAEHIAQGRLGERVLETSGATEDLTRHFNTMAERVQQLVAGHAAERARLEATFEANSDAVLAVSGTTTVRLLNAAALRLFGEERARVLGRPLIESSRDHELDGLVREVATGRLPQSRIIVFGERRTAVRASALPIRGGGDWSVLLVLTDLSDLQRFDKARRDFVSNVSHELRTPLASIKAMVETLENGNAATKEEMDSFLVRIHRQVDRLAALVADLLDLSRIESGALTLNREPVRIEEVGREALALLGPQIAARRLEVTIAAPDLVLADRAALVQILTNLLDNAVKFSEPGTRLALESAPGFQGVAIRVLDRGPGIAPAELARVFERFYKAEHSRSDPGTGLGLAIVKHLVQAQGGSVEARNREGGGAEFVVTLPRAGEGSKKQETESRG